MTHLLKNVIRISVLLMLAHFMSCKEADFLDGYNREELFAAPAQSELDAIQADWRSRDLSVKNYHVEQEVKLANANVTLKIVSFTVSGYKEYAALVIPETGTALPVRVYAGGFDINNNVNSINLIMENIDLDPFVFAFPALRGQSLNINVNGTSYTSPVSEGEHCDAFDGAADDIIAFLNVIEETVPRADMNRTTVRGGSRGATVSLLVAERDKRVKGAVGVAGPVDLLALTALNENDQTYQCQFLNNLVDRHGSLPSARLKMISSSPFYFAALLPKTQLHLGRKDRIVPVSQGETLKATMAAVGMTDSFALFIYADRTHQNIATDNPQLSERISEFLKQF